MKHINFNLNFAKRGAYTPPCNSHLLLSIFMLFAMLMPVKVWGESVTFNGTEKFYLDKASNSGWGTIVAGDASIFLEFSNDAENNKTRSSEAELHEDPYLVVTAPSGTYTKVRIIRCQKTNPSTVWNTFGWITLQSGKNRILNGGSMDSYVDPSSTGTPKPSKDYYLAGEGFDKLEWNLKSKKMNWDGEKEVYYYTYTNVAANSSMKYRFKINPTPNVDNNDWSAQLNANNIDNGYKSYANITLFNDRDRAGDQGDERITFDLAKRGDVTIYTIDNKVFASFSQSFCVASASIQGGPAWANNQQSMTENGEGVHIFKKEGVNASTNVQFKITHTGTWDDALGSSAIDNSKCKNVTLSGSGNITFTTPSYKSDVYFYTDGSNVWVKAVPMGENPDDSSTPTLTSDYYLRGDLWIEGSAWKGVGDSKTPKFVKNADNTEATAWYVMPAGLSKGRFEFYEGNTVKTISDFWGSQTGLSNQSTKDNKIIFDCPSSPKLLTFTYDLTNKLVVKATDPVLKSGMKVRYRKSGASDWTEVNLDAEGSATLSNLENNGKYYLTITDGGALHAVNWYGGLYFDMTNSNVAFDNKVAYYSSVSTGSNYPIVSAADPTGVFNITGGNTDVKVAFDGGKITINKVAAVPNFYVMGGGDNTSFPNWSKDKKFKMTYNSATEEYTYLFNSFKGEKDFKVYDESGNEYKANLITPFASEKKNEVLRKFFNRDNANNNIQFSVEALANVTIHYKPTNPENNRIWVTAVKADFSLDGDNWYIMGASGPNSLDWNKGNMKKMDGDPHHMTIIDGVAQVTYANCQQTSFLMKVFRGSDELEIGCQYLDASKCDGLVMSHDDGANSDNINVKNITQGHDVTFYFDGTSIWGKAALPVENKTVTFVTFCAQSVASQTVAAGSRATTPSLSKIQTQTGNHEVATLKGWYKDEACTQAHDFNTPITDDITLYAKWEMRSETFNLVGDVWMNDNQTDWRNGRNPSFTCSADKRSISVTYIAPKGLNRFEVIRGNDWGYKVPMDVDAASPITINIADGHMNFTLSKHQKVTITYNGKFSVKAEDIVPSFVDNMYLITGENWAKIEQEDGTWADMSNGWHGGKDHNKLRQEGDKGILILRDAKYGEHTFKISGGTNDDNAIAGVNLFNGVYVDTEHTSTCMEWKLYKDGKSPWGTGIYYPSDDNHWRNIKFGLNNSYDLKLTFDGGIIQVHELPKYTITYMSEGAQHATQSVYEGRALEAPTAPEKSGYSFLGWSATDGGEVIDITAQKATEAKTYYAKWEEKGCQFYTFHYGPSLGDDWAEPLCFEKKEGTDHEWQIENFVIDAGKPLFYVGYQGHFYDDNLGTNNSRSAKKSLSEEMYLVMSMKSDNAAGSPKVGAANGAIGTLRIYDNSNWNNLYVGFNPAGYGMMYGANATENSIAINATSNPAVYVSDEITLTDEILNSKYQVGLLRNGGGYVACDNSDIYAVTSIGSCYWNGSDMVWPGNLTHYSAGDKGRIRIWVDNVNKNWLCNFVPTWRLTFDMNGVSATAPAAIEKYSEDSEADRTVDVSTIIPTNVSGHKLFVGWYTEAEGGDKVENPFVLQSNKTLYAHWEELPTPCSYLRKGEYLYLDFGDWNWTASEAVIAAFFYDEQGHIYNGGDAIEPSDPSNMSQFFPMELVSGSIYRVAVPENFLVAIQVCRMSDETSDNGTGRWLWTKGPKLNVADAIEEGYNCVHLTTHTEGIWSTYGLPRTTQCLNLQELIDITEQDGTLTLHNDYADESGTIKEGKTITINGGNHTIGNLTVTTTGKLTVGSNLTVNNFYLQANGASHTSGQVLSPENINVADGAFFDLTLENEHIQYGWYDFCVPFAVDVMSGITGIDHESGVEKTTFTNGVDYAVMEHQGELQAQGQYPYKKFTGTMQPSRLYTITLDDDYNYSTIRFRKASGADLVSGNSVELYAYSGDETHANWNGVGNGTLHHADAGVSVEYVQVYNTGDKTFSAKRTDEVSLVVGTAVMVQATGTMTLSESASHPLLAPARVAAEASETYAIELRQEATQRADRLFYSASEEAEGEYTIGSDLLKAGNIGNVQVPQLWINAFGQKLCVHQAEIIDQQAESSLSLYAPVAGEYTLEITNMPDSENELYLTEDGRPIWNLTQSAVTLDLESGINSKYGLRIVVQPVQTVVTDLWGAKQQGAETFKYIDRGILYLRANGRTIDATGCVVR